MLVKIREGSRILGVSPDHVRRQIRAGHWPYYRLGPKATRIDPEEIKKIGRVTANADGTKQELL
jgi:excisionase family DNA binding protein